MGIAINTSTGLRGGDRITTRANNLTCEQLTADINGTQIVLEKYMEMYQKIALLTARYRDLLVADAERIKGLIKDFAHEEAILLTK